jgi:polysaccharide export outer membrane protein
MPFLVQDLRASRTTRLFAILIVGVLALMLSGCGRTAELGNIPYATAGFGPPQPEPAEVARGEAQIAPYDKLEIKVFQVDDLSGQFQVNSAGQISYPLIGLVSAAGKTPAQLSQVITAQLGAKYLRSPKVQVNITEAAAVEQTVTIDGSVKEPGAHPIKGTTTLMRAVALAKGLGDNANPKRIVVFRTIDGQRLAGGFDLTAIRRAQAEDPIIYPNDIVIVDGKDTRLQSTFREIFYALPILSVFRPF